MSTRTYTLTFAGAATLTAPGGVFFYVKSASAALTIATRGSTTSPIDFFNVGAGLRFGPVSIEKRWTYLDVTSLVAQIVELVVSDDAEVDIASTVNVAGSVTVIDLPSTSVATPDDAVIPPASGVNIPANPARRSIRIGSLSSNTPTDTNLRVCTGVGPDAGVELQPGTWEEFKTTAALTITNADAQAQTYWIFEES